MKIELDLSEIEYKTLLSCFKAGACSTIMIADLEQRTLAPEEAESLLSVESKLCEYGKANGIGDDIVYVEEDKQYEVKEGADVMEVADKTVSVFLGYLSGELPEEE